MTTEIAVVNRLGVALATDSAVTVSGDDLSPKVFDSGDKLFELSDGHPIAVMINGNMDLLGVPWELIVKDFRSHAATCVDCTIKDWMERFLQFSSSHRLMTGRDEEAYVLAIATDAVESIKYSVRSRVLSRQVPPNTAIVDLIKLVAEEQLSNNIKRPRAHSLRQLTQRTVVLTYGKKIKEVIVSGLEPIVVSNKQVSDIQRSIIARLLNTGQSEHTTGLIFAGFGAGDMFPSLCVAEIEGRLCGSLKYSPGQHIAIDRRDNRGGVISFAQTDVIERILSGADNRFIDQGEQWIRAALGGAKDAVVKLFGDLGAATAEAEGLFGDIVDAVGDGYRDEFAAAAKEDFQKAFDGIVALMPKKDLIEFAEALVSITAIERKASTEQATVGGSIDVAFITRHDGFVWIKRKHYFEKDLNPRYFWRKYGTRLALEDDHGSKGG